MIKAESFLPALKVGRILYGIMYAIQLPLFLYLWTRYPQTFSVVATRLWGDSGSPTGQIAREISLVIAGMSFVIGVLAIGFYQGKGIFRFKYLACFEALIYLLLGVVYSFFVQPLGWHFFGEGLFFKVAFIFGLFEIDRLTKGAYHSSPMENKDDV